MDNVWRCPFCAKQMPVGSAHECEVVLVRRDLPSPAARPARVVIKVEWKEQGNTPPAPAARSNEV